MRIPLFPIVLNLSVYFSLATSNILQSLSDGYVEVASGDIFRGSTSYSGKWGPSLSTKENAEINTFISPTGILQYGCTSNDLTFSTPPPSNFVVVVRRGNCTFLDKVVVAQNMGAKGVIIIGNIESTYNYANSDKFPNDNTEKKYSMDYSCENGQGSIPKTKEGMVALTMPPWSKENDDPVCSSSPKCHSHRCIPVEKMSKVCCIWDLPDLMGANPSSTPITIPAIYLSIAEGEQLMQQLPTSGIMFTPSIPPFDMSSVFLWLIAVGTVVYGSWASAAREREKVNQIHRGEMEETSTAVFFENEDGENVIHMNLYHAVGFVIIGSVMLITLFYVNLIWMVIGIFSGASLSAVHIILVRPLVEFFCRTSKSCTIKSYVIRFNDVVSCLVTGGLVMWWFIERNAIYAWILQDIFAVCICLLFLQIIRLPNIKIAIVLLTLAFFYDIFFVFLSPYLFHNNVMLQVAEGGAQMKKNGAQSFSNPGYCLRYPHDVVQCPIIEAIPFLLRLPKISSWAGGYSLLGLGDIVLPGVLVAFTCRYDYSTRGNLVDCQHPNTNTTHQTTKKSSLFLMKYSCKGKIGFFLWMVIGYALGLALAFLGVVLMEQAQPALLYLVPSTLGLLCLISCFQHNFKGLYNTHNNLHKNNISFSRASTLEIPVHSSASV